MSLREGYPEARPPGSHYCLSLSRGDVIRSVRLGRVGVGALAALALISFAWTASVTVYVTCHDDLIGAILARQAEMKAAYEDRLAEARARLDEAASRQLLERNSFNGLRVKFAAAGATVIGVSPDNAASHDKFKRKHDLEIALAADPERSAIEAYGVWKEKSMYGRKYFGVERSTFLIDRNGRIAKIWRKVKVPGHAEEVLAATKAL